MKITKRLSFLLFLFVLSFINCQQEEEIPIIEEDIFELDFTLIYPEFGATEIIPGFEFEWSNSSKAVSYELHLGTTPEANDIIIKDITTTKWIIEELEFATEYYWKVVAVNSAGKTAMSSTHSFTTKQNYFVMNDAFSIPQLDRATSVSLYLPPDYNFGVKRYPVLYMFDGQWVFEGNAGIGEWGVDESMDKIFRESGFGGIIVAIGSHDNHAGQRCDEYSPWVSTANVEGQCRGAAGQLGGEGDEYLSFVVNTLKPYIDNKYRTLQDQGNTGIMGTHLGGLLSLYAAVEYPDIFGKIGVFAPAFWYLEDKIYDFVEEKGDQLTDHKIYFLYGTLESQNFDMPGDVQRMIELLLEKGVSNVKKKGFFGENHQILPRGGNNLWNAGFPDAFKWLFIE